MQSESVETSLFDLLTAALKGKLIGTVNGSDSGDSNDAAGFGDDSGKS